VLTLQEISDRIEIQELLVRYSHAVDTRDWEMYENVFTPDAFIDYTCFGGPAGGVKEIRAFLEMAMPNFSSFQHMIANTVLDFVDADHVKGRTICHNPMVMDLGGDKTHVFYCGLWYVDEIVRTADGWRIAKRVEEKSYTHNMPEGFAVPED
jgi:3-phenylpropionate/cinnamic acid dioxygenase small subunit